MLIVGLTGGIATGKSTVSAQLRAAGLPIVDADLVAREVVEPGTHTLEAIKLAFGGQIITNGVLDRQQLGQRVFSHPAELARLNAIIQPAISAAMTDKINFWRQQKTPILILDVPLLFERGYDTQQRVDKIIVVTADAQQQLARLKARDHLDDQQARARIQAQMPLAEKVAQADYVIDNTGDAAQLQVQIQQLLTELKELAPKYDTK
ncbi:dephospho-CoA kinase [Leuconostoc holzapfelii]|uniref:Dephospho-CoA kinase n=1 Tax=Leuconostoc holzapfelii TaxID=434464 RepID=A0ABT2NTL8_9LACO|nr:dephospho-CoA kinase [Leuconostoc holzapfelii]MCT8388715.1 dephospho-CoA kinase [Leuconostoc holzapfelii]